MLARDQHRVLAVEADPASSSAFAVDVLVRVDENSVRPAEPPSELVEPFAQHGVGVVPRVARESPFAVLERRLLCPVAVGGGNHRAGAGQQRLRMARGLGLRHRELHVREEPARTTLADVHLRLRIRSGRRRAYDVQLHVLAEPLQLCGRHGLIVP